jgi:hypothetical protein
MKTAIGLPKEELVYQIKIVSNYLDKLYANKTRFRNHCYLRIAYDNTCNNKWDIVVHKPYIKNATEIQLNTTLQYLNKYKYDFNEVLSDNHKSLKFRNKI